MPRVPRPRGRTGNACGTARLRCGGPAGSDGARPSGDVGRLLLDRREPRGGDVAAAGLGRERSATRPAPGWNGPAGRPAGWRRRGWPCRCASSSTAGARAAASGSTKSARKRCRVVSSPPPSVDRLVRVAHRGDRHRRARRDEQRPEQLQLGLGGVLELVEQHRAEPRPLGDPDLRHGGRDTGGERHLVGEVHGVTAALELVVALDQGQHRPARAAR